MKARIKSTGEIVEVFDYRYGSKISSENFVAYIDSNGHPHCDKGVDFEEDFEEVSEDEALQSDKWEQRRYEIAKDIMAAFLSNSCVDVHGDSAEEHASDAVLYADILIAELKKGGSQ